jgi:glucosamine--fructose-6-phosphate aminotransferase (isomerizing)
MSSVVGYIGKNYSWDFVIDALVRLEYRGYDAAGFACLDSKTHEILYRKSVGHLDCLIDKVADNVIDGNVGVGHTRWATHGVSTEVNAHPQFDEAKRLAVVHNGIIENHHILRAQLRGEGHVFYSETDTEVIAHYLEFVLEQKKHAQISEVLVSMVERLQGAYAFICILQQKPDLLIAVRKGSTLCIGIGEGEFFVASDPIAFAGRCEHVLYMPDETFALVTRQEIELYDFEGTRLTFSVEPIDIVWEDTGHEFESHMLKEIYEQKQAINAGVAFFKSLHQSGNLWNSLGFKPDFFKNLNQLMLFGSGTSWHAAQIGKFFIESIAKIPVNVALASELRYMPFFPGENILHVAISQSGETADTLEALRMITAMNASTLALTNVPSSTIVREADGFLLLKAGPERSVCATKVFTSELAILYVLALCIAFEKGVITQEEMDEGYKKLFIAAQALESTLERYKYEIMATYSPRYAQYEKFIFVGRHVTYPFALEAALKLKETSYLFAQCYPAGELKHGAMTLIDEHVPVILYSHVDPAIYKKLVSTAQEIKARNGHLIVFGFKGQEELAEIADCFFEIPTIDPLLGPIAMAGLMQIFVYYIAKELDRPIDKPRNVAKTVTVE